MQIKLLFIFGVFIFSEGLKAQTDFKSGYVIKSNRDTIFGQIDYRGDLLMGKVCRFKNKEGEVIEYSPKDIDAYRFTNSKYFVSRDLNGNKVFLEYLIKGKVSIYYRRDDLGDHFYLDKDNVKLVEIPYEERYMDVDEKRMLYRSKKHVGIMKYYMQDAPSLQSKINSLKKPEHKNLVRLAEDYHYAVCKDEQCIIFEKNRPLLRIFPELIFGEINYFNAENVANKNYMNIGIIGHLWMPFVNEKLYFRTGVLYSKIDFKDEKTNFFKIPFQIEFIYPKGIFRPRIAYGVNLYNSFDETVSFDIGGNFKLTDKVSISATSDLEFNPSGLIFPKNIIAYSIKLGLFMTIK